MSAATDDASTLTRPGSAQDVDRATLRAIMEETGAATPKEAMMKVVTMPQAEQSRVLSQAMARAAGGALDVVRSVVEENPDAPLCELRGSHCEEFCNGCGGASNEGESFSKCGGCRAVRYCSKDCQRRDWSGKGRGGIGDGRSHKEMCPELQEIVEEFESHPSVGKGLIKELFSSWADQHHPKSGEFFLTEFLARKKLLGNDETVGYWAVPNVMGTYHESGPDPSGFLNGSMLLRPRFPSAQNGWTTALRPDEFSDISEPPSKDLPEGGIQSWKEYLEYRSLEPTTVAPLLLTNVLSVYHMIQHRLKLTELVGSILRVDLLGAEVELNQVPLFGELAHLLPKGTDLTLTFISKATKEICEQVKKEEYVESIIAKSQDGVVLDVTNEARETRIRVCLCADHALYQDVPDEPVGDAVLSLNAEIPAYPTWSAAVHKALRLGKPLCVTDTSRVTARNVEVLWLPQAFGSDPPVALVDIETELNPFHGIVRRDVAAADIPDMRNGYSTTIVGKDS